MFGNVERTADNVFSSDALCKVYMITIHPGQALCLCNTIVKLSEQANYVGKQTHTDRTPCVFSCSVHGHRDFVGGGDFLEFKFDGLQCDVAVER